jgi:hypothetical protein
MRLPRRLRNGRAFRRCAALSRAGRSHSPCRHRQPLGRLTLHRTTPSSFASNHATYARCKSILTYNQQAACFHDASGLFIPSHDPTTRRVHTPVPSRGGNPIACPVPATQQPPILQACSFRHEALPMRPRDPPMLLSLHDWLTTSDSEPENFLTPLKERLSPCYEAGLPQGTHASGGIRHDPGIMLSRHDWLTRLEFTPNYFLTLLERRSSPYLDEELLQGAHAISQEPREVHPDKTKAPLKSSMKSVPESAEETSAESAIDLTNAAGHRKAPPSLRRVKTVEFQDVEATGMRIAPPLAPWSSDTIFNLSDEHKSQGELTTKSQRIISREPSCSLLGTKSKLADPALTKTDVHVVTLAPAYRPAALPREPDLGVATPTMQLIKSADSRLEAVWDDVPAEDNKRAHRKASTASRALHTVNPATRSGLEHVNSNLYEWSWARGPGLESFAPQVVVFPDDEGHAHAVTYMTDDEGNPAMRAPANSQRTSSAPSYSSSVPATTRPSRPPSQDESEPTNKLQVNKLKYSGGGTTEALAIPDPEAKLGTIATLPDKFKKSQTDRRLSNIDDSERKFRGHRDSVTIARSRLLHDIGLPPELLEVQKYSSTAKRRMHVRTRGKSEEEIATPEVSHGSR